MPLFAAAVVAPCAMFVDCVVAVAATLRLEPDCAAAGTASLHLQNLSFVFSQTSVDLSSASTPPVLGGS